MSKEKHIRSDANIAIVVEALCVFASLIAFAIFVAGCSRTIGVDNKIATGETTSSSNSALSETWTWNRTPHGGSDEKSSSTPAQPVQRSEQVTP